MKALDAGLSSYQSAAQELFGRKSRLTPSEVTQTFQGTKLITSFEEFTEYTKGYLDDDALQYVKEVLNHDADDIAKLKKIAQLVEDGSKKIGKKLSKEELKAGLDAFWDDAGVEGEGALAAIERVFKGIKSGKDILKNIQKVEYGSDELSKVAIEYRRINGITSARRNICAVEYMDAEGAIVRKAFVSNESYHSKEIMIQYLKENNVLGKNVLKIFSEREPCVETVTNRGHNCAQHISDFISDVDLRYVVDYGLTQEDGANARKLKGILKKIL